MVNQILVDSNVILDIFTQDPNWYPWSRNTLNQYGLTHELCINPIIYTEISIAFERIEDLERTMHACRFKWLALPKEALFLAGKIFLQYRRNKGKKVSPLPDFLIGAHASILNIPLITRDTKRTLSYFPKLSVITP